MPVARSRYVAPQRLLSIGGFGCAALIAASSACGRFREQPKVSTTLRLGVGGLSLGASDAGLQPVVGALWQEALVSPLDDGRLRPWLAEGWTTAADGLSVI